MTNPAGAGESSTATIGSPSTPVAGLVAQLRGSEQWAEAVDRLRAVSDEGEDVGQVLLAATTEAGHTDAEDEFSDDEDVEDLGEDEDVVPRASQAAARAAFDEFHRALVQCAAAAGITVGGKQPKKIIARSRARYHALAFVADIQLLIHPDRGPNAAARDMITRSGACATVIGLCEANSLGPLSGAALTMLEECEVAEPTSQAPSTRDTLQKLQGKLDNVQLRFLQLAGREWAEELGPRPSAAAAARAHDKEFTRRTENTMAMSLHIYADAGAAPARRQGNVVALGVLADALALVYGIAPGAAADLARDMLPTDYDPQEYGVVHDIASTFIVGQLAQNPPQAPST